MDFGTSHTKFVIFIPTKTIRQQEKYFGVQHIETQDLG